ncbi:MAG: M36 family metallopeptidase [Lysobacteraceae bacterium]
MKARSDVSRTPRSRALAALIGLLCTVPALAATPGQVDKEFWLTLDKQSLIVSSAANGVFEKTAATTRDLRFRYVFNRLPAQKRGKVLTPEGLARVHLGLLDGVGAKRATQDSLKLANVSQLRNGAQIVQFETEVGGIEVFRRGISVLMDGNQNLRAISGVWPNVPQQALSKALPTYQLDAQQALGLALNAYGFNPQAVSADARPAYTQGGYLDLGVSESLRGADGEQVQSARAKQVLFPNGEQLIAAWYVETVVGKKGTTGSDYFAHVVDAITGDILFRHNQTEYEDYKWSAWADPDPSFIPFPGPQGRQTTPYPAATDQGILPPAVSTNLISIQNTPFSQNDPWLPDGATVTTGNNTQAYADISGGDGFDGSDVAAPVFPAAAPADPLPYDTTQAPDSLSQREAAVRQMFYLVNWVHDWYYDAGFDEAAGNAQTNNFGRGGLGNDSIRSEGQDFSGTNNANMSTPADGARPRMQMYVFSPVSQAFFTRLTPAPQHDSAGVGVPGWNSTPFDLTGNVVQATDVDEDAGGPATTTDGCSAIDNPGAISGNIAFVDRGSCNFTAKVQNAFNAGATGLVIGNVASSSAPGTMGDGGTPPTGGAENMPALLINFSDAEDLRAALGSSPTGRMFRGAGVAPDGTIDNQIMAHELGHYISNRLVHDSAGLTTNHSRGLGEGWADFHAMLMTVKDEDSGLPFGTNFAGAYGMAAYSVGNYWAGIRRFPYSTDFAISPLTYADIVGDGSGTGSDNAEVHNTGELWASSLWQCYAGLLTTSGLPFGEVQQRMKEYLIAGYKLTPPSPFFTEARDAVLAAIIATGEIDDFEICAAGFADRGLGIYAEPPSDRSGNTNAGAVENFDIDGRISLGDIGNIDDSSASCDVDGVLDVGEEGVINLPFSNTGWLSLFGSEVQVSSDFPGLTFPGGATIAAPNTVPYQNETIQIPVSLDSAPGGNVTLTFTASDPDVGTPPAPLVVSMAMNFDYAFAASDDFEASMLDVSNAGWHTAEEYGASSSKKWVKRDVSGSQVAFGADIGSPGVAWLESPSIDVGPVTTLELSHRFSFEAGAEPDGNYDGGVVEISVDGGPWTELSLPEYTNTLSACCSNPLAGRDAFTLDSAGYPAFTSLTIDLGTAYNGSSVRLRFGVAEDAAAEGIGWDIDTVTVADGLNLPFPVGAAPQAQDCTTDTAPVAVDDSITVLQGGSVTVLDGGATSVRDNDTDVEDGVPTGVVALVTGVAAGNSLTLNPDGTFSYTDGTDANDSFTYTVEDSDGNVSAPATVSIVVNHAPTVAAGIADQTNDEGDSVNISLAAAFADSDADSLSFSASNLPADISIVGDALVGTLSANSAAGSPYTVDVTADDGRGGTVQDSFQWTVNDTQANTDPVNDSAIPDQNNVENDSVSIDLASHFSDPDGDPLTFSADVLPDGVSISGSAITGTLSLVSAGSYSVTITADDGFGGMVSAPAFTWNVSPSATISTPANVTVAELWVGDTAAPTFDIGNIGDAGAPDLAWTISESTDNCATTGADAVPWLSATPSSDSTAQGAITAVTVDIDTAALTHGANVQASLCIASNDPAAPVQNVPVIITALRPAHDLFARARTVTIDGSGLYNDVVPNPGLATRGVGTAGGAPPVDPDFSCRFGGAVGPGSDTLWYAFSPPDDGLLTVDTLGSTAPHSDTMLHVVTYDGSVFTELPGGCSEDFGTGLTSRIENLRLNQGTVYYIEAARYSATDSTASGGQLLLNVDFHAYTGEAVMTLAPPAINTSVPSATATTQDVVVSNLNSTGDRPLEWEIVDQSGGWRPEGLIAGPIGDVTTLSVASGATSGVNGGGAELRAAATSLEGVVDAQAPVLDAINLGLTLGQTASNIPDTNAVHCAATGGNPTRENRYLRAFTLADYGISDAFNVTGISVGVYGSTVPATLTAKLYLLNGGTLTYANLTEIGSATLNLPALGLANAVFDVPLGAVVAPDQTLVVEFAAPDLASGVFYFGANSQGESAPAYFVAPSCGLNEPTPLAAIGFPTLHVPLTITGEFVCDTPTDLNWLDVDTYSGSIEANDSQTVSFTLGGAAVADGGYAANLCVVSNDPAQQIRLYPVTLAVGDIPEITVTPAQLDPSALVDNTTVETLTIGNEGASDLIWSVEAEDVARSPDVDLQARSASVDVGSLHPIVAQPQAPGDVIFEGFEAGVPPAGWTVESLAPAPVSPWAVGTFEPQQGTNAAQVLWSHDGATVHDRDEWLLSPVLDMTMANLSFWSAGSPFWCRDDNSPTANNNCDVEVWVVVGAVGGGDDVLVGLADDAWPAGTPFVWAQSNFDLTPFLSGGDFRIGFRYVGIDAADVKIDAVTISDTTPVPCDDPMGAPWISFDLSDGVVPPAGTQDVNVTFDASGLAEGVYNANVCVVSNDYDEPVVAVPVTFTVAVNSAPSFSAGSDSTVNEDAGAQTVPAWATAMDDGDGGTQNLAFNVTGNTNASLFSVAPAVDATTGDLTFTPAADANGTADITVVLMDDGGTGGGGMDTSASATFTITVNAVNDAPSFAPGGDESVAEDSGAATVSAWATGISAGPADESSQVLTFNVSNDNNALFSVQPSIDATTGDLTFTPAANANGSATVSVTLSDDGGTANGGVDTTDPAVTFTIEVTAVNDDPELVGTLNDQENDEGDAVSLDISVAFSDVDGDDLSFDASGLPAGLSISPAGVISGTVDFSAGDDDPSSYTVTITVDDGNGGSTTAQFDWTINNVLLPDAIFSDGFED